MNIEATCDLDNYGESDMTLQKFNAMSEQEQDDYVAQKFGEYKDHGLDVRFYKSVSMVLDKEGNEIAYNLLVNHAIRTILEVEKWIKSNPKKWM
jgi:hypothetical protein